MSYVRNLRRLPNPAVVPSVPVRLIDGHPLGIAGGLVAEYVPGAPNGGFKNLAAAGDALAPTVTTPLGGILGSPKGPGFSSPNDGNWLQENNPPASLQLQRPASLFWFGAPVSIKSATSFGIVTQNGDDNFIKMQVTATGSAIVYFSVGPSANHAASATIPNAPFSVGASWNLSGAYSIFAQGEPIGSGTDTTSLSYSSVAVVLGGDGFNKGNGCINLIGALYASALLSSQQAQLAAEPFCMLERSGRMRSWSFPSTSLFNVSSSFNLLSEVLSSLTSLDIIYVDSTAINLNPKDLGIGRRKQKFGSGRSLDPFGVGQKQSIFGIGDP